MGNMREQLLMPNSLSCSLSLLLRIMSLLSLPAMGSRLSGQINCQIGRAHV